MKAILRWGTGLLSLLLLGSGSYAYVWVTPVTRCPYPQAPSLYNTAPIYYVDSYGRLSAPYYYLVPPGRPYNGYLPGPIGAAITSGNLPHNLLLSKEAMSIGNMPLLGQKAPPQGAPPAPMQPTAPFASPAPMAPMMPYPPMPYPAGPHGMPMAYPMAPPNMQSPYAALPSPYPIAPPYGPAPYAAMPMPYPAPQPAMPRPYPMPQQAMSYYPTANVYPAQNAAPGGPMMTIPNYRPAPPTIPGMPAGGQMDPFQYYGPMDPMLQFNALQAARPDMAPMQAPRMDAPPPPQKPGGAAYPVHPFTRSPRDFFMWGEAMEDEQKMRNRPFPVPR